MKTICTVEIPAKKIKKIKNKKKREDFIDQGGYDGRFRTKVKPNDKQYKKPKYKDWLKDEDE